MQELADSRRKEQTLRQQLATTTTALSSSSPLLPPQQQQQRRQTAERKQRPAQKKKHSSSSTKPPAKATGVGAEPRRRRRRRQQQGSGTARSRPHETAAFVQPPWDGSPRKTLELGAPLQPLDRAVQPESTFDGWEMFLPEVEEAGRQMKANRGARSTAS